MTPPGALARLCLLLLAALLLLAPAGAMPSSAASAPPPHAPPASRAPRAPRTAAQGNNAHTAADPCLEHDYAVENYATCCAHGGYKVEGHKEVCRLAKADLVKKRDQSGV